MTRSLLTAAALAFATAASASATASASEADLERGRQLAYTCTGCHGVEGYRNTYPTYHVPKIGGQNEAYLVAALNAYKAGERQHPTMRAQAESFSERDIADIAAYLSSLKAE